VLVDQPKLDDSDSYGLTMQRPLINIPFIEDGGAVMAGTILGLFLPQRLPYASAMGAVLENALP
jgi:hypothetical protein